MHDLTHLPYWLFPLILGYPVLVIAILEGARRLTIGAPFASNILRQVAFVLLPTAALWLVLRGLAELPPYHVVVRMAETFFALTALYLLLRIAQAALMSLVDESARAPKLLLDVLRIGLSVAGGCVVISNIWDVNLGSLLAAMGVGSIALAFALQEFLGNLLSGLALLSAHKFGIGDWILVDSKPAKVIEMDWRTVTLETAGGDTVVVANSTLAKGNLTITSRAKERASIAVPLAIGVEIPPEKVRETVLEAGKAMPNMDKPDAVQCLVTAIGRHTIKYNVVLSVDNPGILSKPRDDFLSRFWYAAQRRGLRVDSSPVPDAAMRLQMLEEKGAFHRDADVISPLAQASEFRRYRRGDLLLAVGEGANNAFFVSSGRLAVAVLKAEGESRIETVEEGQLLVLQEMLAGGVSPVKVTADQDSDILAIAASALVNAMDSNRAVARDIRAVTEARRQAILPFDRGLRIVA